MDLLGPEKNEFYSLSKYHSGEILDSGIWLAKDDPTYAKYLQKPFAIFFGSLVLIPSTQKFLHISFLLVCFSSSGLSLFQVFLCQICVRM